MMVLSCIRLNRSRRKLPKEIDLAKNPTHYVIFHHTGCLFIQTQSVGRKIRQLAQIDQTQLLRRDQWEEQQPRHPLQ